MCPYSFASLSFSFFPDPRSFLTLGTFGKRPQTQRILEFVHRKWGICLFILALSHKYIFSSTPKIVLGKKKGSKTCSETPKIRNASKYSYNTRWQGSDVKHPVQSLTTSLTTSSMWGLRVGSGNSLLLPVAYGTEDWGLSGP